MAFNSLFIPSQEEQRPLLLNEGGKEVAQQELKRDLKNRHVQLIAIGGTIGTGLFLGSGKAIQLAGPSIIFAYLIVGIACFFCNEGIRRASFIKCGLSIIYGLC
jgi:amino acid permease